MVLGSATIRFADTKAGIDETREVAFVTPVTDEAIPVSWEKSTEAPVTVSELQRSPDEPARYAPVPAAASKAKNYESWSRQFATWLAANQRLDLLKDPGTRTVSKPGESERDFRIRLRQAGHEARDRTMDGLRKRYAPKIAALEERIRRSQQAVERESREATQQQLQTAISVGATLLGAFLGRKVASASTLGRATTAARGAGRSVKAREDVLRAQQTVEALQQQLADLEAEFKTEARSLGSTNDPRTIPLEPFALKPKKGNVSVKLVALVWAPH
jgi:hypothetical protein